MAWVLFSSILLSSVLNIVALAPSSLIVQNKGGGHGELGYHTATALSNLGHSVTLLQDSSFDKSKQPYASYPSLPPSVTVVECDMSDLPTAVSTSSYDYIIDNYSKDATSPTSKSLLALGSPKAGCKKYLYISSAGIYDPPPGHGGDASGPLLESFPVKSSSGQFSFESALKSAGVPLFAFRPQYIYGPLANKFSYLDYFFSRISSRRPLPIPGSGSQLVSLTSAPDVASLLSCCVTCPAASPGVYNCGSPEVRTYNEVARMCGEACGEEPDVYNYETGGGGG
ncbi:hypothetical protein TrRE_jg4086, partial [Triparma retinervis]